MIKTKNIRIIIKLECIDCKSKLRKNFSGVSRYYSEKNRHNNPESLKLKKYCSYCNKSTIHKEIK